jgi:hypothetical protein
MLRFRDGMLMSDYFRAIEFQAQGGIVPLMEFVDADGGIVDEIRKEDERERLKSIG